MKWVIAVAGLAAASVLASAAEAQAPSQAEALMAVDRDFAAYAAAHGVANGFRAYMDPKDGLEFAGGEPRRGAEAIYQAEGGGKPEAARLTWTPTEAFVAKSDDLGVTWGRWTDTPIDPAKKALTGRYVTVWRKDAEGHWKGLIDIGTPD